MTCGPRLSLRTWLGSPAYLSPARAWRFKRWRGQETEEPSSRQLQPRPGGSTLRRERWCENLPDRGKHPSDMWRSHQTEKCWRSGATACSILWVVWFGMPRAAGRFGKTTMPDQSSPVSAVAFSPDNSLLAEGFGESIRLVDAATGRERTTVSTGQGDVEGVAFSADGRLLASGGENGTILVWDVAQVLASKRRESTDTARSSPDVKGAPEQKEK